MQSFLECVVKQTNDAINAMVIKHGKQSKNRFSGSSPCKPLGEPNGESTYSSILFVDPATCTAPVFCVCMHVLSTDCRPYS
jgi:hypothetical protein